MPSLNRFHAELAWVEGRLERDVLLTVVGDRFSAVDAGHHLSPGDAVRLPGLTLPGLVNAHSHAFHRALRGRTHQAGGDFWSWRDLMYRVAAHLDPERLHHVARAVYAEMALSGITTVGEFHYVHHQPDGTPYDAPNEMGNALVAAAGDAGVRLTLLDTCYLHAGFDSPVQHVQRRFSDGSAEQWATRLADLDDRPTVRIGAAIHSVRAVDRDAMSFVAAHARERSMPLHLHLSEQPAENDACRAATGMTPAQLAGAAGVLAPSTTLVHATHLEPDDIALIGRSGTAVCLCPTTERDLADGIGPAAELVSAGAALCVGSDSNAVIDLFEEARAIELDDRLRIGHRGVHAPASLLVAATAAGAAALGWDAGALVAGGLADFITIDVGGAHLAGFDDQHAAAHVVFSAGPADVRSVVVGGVAIVRAGQHLRVANVGDELRAAVEAVL